MEPIRRAAFLLFLAVFAVTGMGASAKCYPAGTRVIVFVQGLYSTYDEHGTQTTFAENHRFETLKTAFVAKGYDPRRLLDFSYAGGSFDARGGWQPEPYGCDVTDRQSPDGLAVLESMLRGYRERYRGAHFALVGHSVGGYLAFLEGARDAARPEGDRLGIDVVVTLDAPLLGASADKKAVIDLIDCSRTYLAGGELVAAQLDPFTPDVRRYQAWAMAQAGVRLGTYGNVNDCLWNTNACVGAGFVDDSPTQFLPGQAAVSVPYAISSAPLASHDAILANPSAVADVVAFVGAP